MIHADQSRKRKFTTWRSRHNQSGASQGIRCHLRFELLENRLNLSTLLGTVGDDVLLVDASGSNSGSYSLNGGPAVAFSGITTFHFDGLGGNDLLQIKHPAGGAFAPTGGITYDGGEGIDGVEVIGGGDDAGRYAPGVTSDSGTITVSDGDVESTLRFTGLEPTTVSGFGAFTFPTPGSDDVLTIDSPAPGQNRISGTSGGMAFEALTFFDIANFTLDTGTNDGALPNDQITIDASGLVATGLVNFTVSSGTGGDSLSILSTSYATPGSVNGVAFQAGTGTDTDTDIFIGNANIGYVLTNSGVTSSAGGTVAFSSVDQANLTGGGSANTFTINSTSILANLAGGGGNDTFTFANGATLAGGTIDGGGDSDTLDYSAYSTALAVNLGANVSSLSANLDGDQEVPATASTATGTATITYNNTAHTIDIVLTVSGIAPSDPGLRFHVHRASTGVNGPIIVDLFNAPPPSTLGTLTPTGPTSFTFTATNVPLDALHEAALLGGITYVNVHTAAFPGGEIRGQVFPSALFVAAPGTATGTAGVSNIENATGGAGSFNVGPSVFGDSIVGNNNANVLRGGSGSDVVVGVRGDDTLEGDAGADIMVWSNGDGTDVMNGGADNDLVNVNGNPTAGDVFEVGAGPMGRVDFDRISPAPFGLDIGTTETLTVNGIGGGDSFATVNSLTGNNLTGIVDLTAINFNGFDGSDVFNITPDTDVPADADITVNVRGHLPRPPASPGDQLNYMGSGTVNPSVPGSGNITQTGVQNVNYAGIETVNAVGGTLNVTIDANDDPAPGNQANDGVPDTFRVVRSGANVQVFVNGALVFEGAYASVDNLAINGSGDSDTLIVDESGGNPVPAGGIDFTGAGETVAIGDSLQILGGVFNTVTYTLTPDTPDGGPFTATGHNGNVSLDGSVVRFTGLEPITNTGTTVNAIFNLPDDGQDNQAILEDDGNLANGMVRLRSGNATFETTVFTNPTFSTRIAASDDGETITLARLDSAYGAYVELFGNTGFDTFLLDFSSGVNIIPQALAPPHIALNGGGGADALLILAGYNATTITHTYQSEGTGSTPFDGVINIDGGVIRYRDLDETRGILDQLSAVNRVFTLTDGADDVQISDAPGAADGITRIRAPGSAAATDFKNPTAQITVNGNQGADTFTNPTFDTLGAPPVANLNGRDGVSGSPDQGDTFVITPSVVTTFNIDGDRPTPSEPGPGDSLNVDTTGTTNPVLTSTSTPDGFQGSYTFGDRSPVNFSEIESLSGVPTVSVSDASAEEGDVVVFTLTLSAPSNQPVTVRVNTTSGTATGNVDYNQIDSFADIVFPSGATTRTIAVQTFEDALNEPDETFFLNVLQTTNAGVADGQGVGTINDVDTGISVSVDSNGKLIVDGSGEDDIVTITGVPPGVAGSGMYLVTTQQGSQPQQIHNVSGVTGDICVNLHAGNDQLTMNNAYVNGSIIIDMESGNDTVTLGDLDVVSTRADLDVDLGTGHDVLDGKRIFIGGNQLIVGGDGDDDLTFDGFASPFTLGTSAAGNANWSTGNGDDTVHVIYAFIVGTFAIDLGAGTDSLDIFGSAASSDVSFLGGTGIDSLTVDTNFFDANLLLDGGGDGDAIFLANGLGTDVGTINTDGGDDTVTIRNETQGRLNIDTGSGDDTVDVQASAFDLFFALLGEDNDELELFGNLLRVEALLDGGPGSDRLINRGNDARGTVRTRNFEFFD